MGIRGQFQLGIFVGSKREFLWDPRAIPAGDFCGIQAGIFVGIQGQFQPGISVGIRGQFQPGITLTGGVRRGGEPRLLLQRLRLRRGRASEILRAHQTRAAAGGARRGRGHRGAAQGHRGKSHPGPRWRRGESWWPRGPPPPEVPGSPKPCPLLLQGTVRRQTSRECHRGWWWHGEVAARLGVTAWGRRVLPESHCLGTSRIPEPRSLGTMPPSFSALQWGHPVLPEPLPLGTSHLS